MDLDEFRERAEHMLDYITNYYDTISEKRIFPDVEPGFLKSLLPTTPPKTGEPFDKIMEDFEKYIMPGLTHWQHPGFHAFVPASCSYPSILAELLCGTVASYGLNSDIFPFGCDLETIVLNWLGKLIGLPDTFLHCDSKSKGGGIILGTASECVFLCLLSARQDRINSITERIPSISKSIVLTSLVAYCSNDSTAATFKTSMISLINVKVLDTDEDHQLRGKTLAQAIREDKKIGLIPFFVCISLGTVCGTCDSIDEIGPVCKEFGIWLHVNAAYGGIAPICPEFKSLLQGIEYASSFNVSPSKWMLVNLNCDTVFMKDISKANYYMMLAKSNKMNRGYESKSAFQSLKLWFVMRCYGVKGLQRHIRNHVRLAGMFQDLVKKDDRFEVLTCQLGIVCFRLNSPNEWNSKLVDAINSSGKLLLSSFNLNDKCAIRFTLCSENVNENDVANAWKIISEYATKFLQEDEQDQLSSYLFKVGGDFD